MAQLDINHLREWVGRKDSASERITAQLVQRFNATLGLSCGTMLNEAAPLLIHFCLAQPAVAGASLGSDGHPARGGFLPPVPLPRRMWAGGAFTFHESLRIGDDVSRVSEIKDVVLKEGRSGQLIFVTVEHRISVAGLGCVTERQDIVYRDAEAYTPAPAGSLALAPAGEQQRRIVPTSTLLFRYSALTFNGHRIHYDAPYVRDVEGYPGLIVQGPMQATQLAHLAADIGGRAPKAFSFRSLSPLFDIADYTLNASAEGDRLKLWAARIDGPVAMEALAEW